MLSISFLIKFSPVTGLIVAGVRSVKLVKHLKALMLEEKSWHQKGEITKTAELGWQVLCQKIHCRTFKRIKKKLKNSYSLT